MVKIVISTPSPPTSVLKQIFEKTNHTWMFRDPSEHFHIVESR